MNKNTEVLDFLYDDETHNIDKITNLIHPEYAPLGIIDYKIGISRKAFNKLVARSCYSGFKKSI